MKNLPITWRLNLGLAIFASLGLAGAILTWWIGKENESRQHEALRRQFQILRLANEIMEVQSKRDRVIQDQVFAPGSSSVSAAEADLQFNNLPDEFGGGLDDAAELRPELDQLKRQVYPELASLEAVLMKMSATNSPRAGQVYLNEYRNARASLTDALKNLKARARQAPQRSDAGLFTVEAMLVIVLGLFALWTVAMLRHNLIAFKEPVNELRGALDRVAAGDFTIDVQLKRKDEFADLANGIINMTKSLAILIDRIHQNANLVVQSARSILTASVHQQKAVEEIEHVGEFLSDAGRKIDFSAGQLGGTINIASQASESAARLGSTSSHGLENLGTSMDGIKDAADAINSKLEILSEKAGNVSQIVVTMSKMADQTNLLSINAAIEAEKAGAAGKGFAVVANEIQRLADQTAVATEDIEQLVKEMQTAVAAGVIGTEQFDNEVRTGADRLALLAEAVSEINHQIETLRPQIEVINTNIHTQADGARQIQNRSGSLSQSMKTAADSLQTVKASANQLEHATRELEEGMTRFTIND